MFFVLVASSSQVLLKIQEAPPEKNSQIHHCLLPSLQESYQFDLEHVFQHEGYLVEKQLTTYVQLIVLAQISLPLA